MITLSSELAQAVFDLPRIDGEFRAETFRALNELSQGQRAVLLAFPPKSAGTFFTQAVIGAANGTLVRLGHALGGRDTQPYLPTLIAYYSGSLAGKVMVTLAHMQALPANIHMLEAFGIRPIIMMRSIPDMLASYCDMLDKDAEARNLGLNCLIPPGFETLPAGAKADFAADILAPWYASYFATWLGYAQRAPGQVYILHYRDFRTDPAYALECALEHAGILREPEICEAAVAQAWSVRGSLRFNRGERGRGRNYLGPQHLAQIERMLRHYPDLVPHLDELLGRGAFAADRSAQMQDAGPAP